MNRKKKAKIWEYQLHGADVHGPFSTEEMQGWIAGGYFNEGNVQVRPVIGPKEAKKWTNVLEMDLEGYLEKLS